MTAVAAAQVVNYDQAPATAVYNKALRLFEKHKWAAAKEYFHQYLAEYSDTPLYVTCLYYLAYCYQQLKDKRQAVILYHRVIERAKNGDEFWGQMAQKRLQDQEIQGEGS